MDQYILISASRIIYKPVAYATKDDTEFEILHPALPEGDERTSIIENDPRVL